MRTIAILAVFVALGCSYTEQQSIAASDEIIVKFAADQAVNETIVRAFDDADAEASLTDTVQTLSNELAVPFNFSRLTSGREIVIEVPEERIYEKIAENLRQADGVENVTLASSVSGDPTAGPGELLVRVDSGKVGTHTDADADLLAARLIADERYPVNCEINADGRLAIRPDFERLVGDLAAALNRRPDVDYAQPNFRVRHYDKAK